MNCPKGCGDMLEGELRWVCGWCGYSWQKTPPPSEPLPGLVRVPEGEFWMGSEEGDVQAQPYEKPQRKVFLSAYEIGVTPITNGQYAEFVRETGYSPPAHWEKRPPLGENARHPVCFVTWLEAMAYCQWLSARTGLHFSLPTEAQWEKAARGGLGGNPLPFRRFPYGDSEFQPYLGNYGGLEGGTTPVGKYPQGASPYGCLDMSGNVSEWCLDTFFPDAYRSLPFRDPLAKGEGKKVLKGGSWRSEPLHLRCSNRYFYEPGKPSYGIGFRIVSITGFLNGV